MTTLVIVLVVISIAVPAALAFAHWRLQKRDRIRLRLQRGRSRLLGEEIEQRTIDLLEYDDERLTPARTDAERALNELHVAMMDRHAHMLNSQDLAHLQRHKIAIQEHAMSQLLAREMSDQTTEDGDDAQAATSSDEIENKPRRDRRGRIEEDLLDKIDESNKAQPKKGRRR